MILTTQFIFGQYDFEWAEIYGGDSWDEAYSAIETPSGNLLISGYTKLEEKHIWLLKITPKGKIIFGKTIKTVPESEAKDLLFAKDSSIVMAGYCRLPFSFTSDLWILKLNKYGEKLWYKNYGGEMDEKANCLIETSDSGYVAAGYTSSTFEAGQDAFLIKVDNNGDVKWERKLGGEKNDNANAVIETKDKNIIMCGTTGSQGDGYRSMWLVCLNSEGNEIWDKTYSVNKWDVGTSLVQAADGYIYVTGYTRTFSIHDYDAVLLKLDTDGNLIWKKVFSWNRWDQTTSLIKTYDHGIAISGFSRSGKENSSDFVTCKFDSTGNIIWQDVFRRKSLDYSNKIIETKDNGLVIVGKTFRPGSAWDFAVLKYKNNEQPEIIFHQDSVSSSTMYVYKLKVCINTKNNLKNVQLFFNDSLHHDNIKMPDFNEANKDCGRPLEFDLNLNKGVNTIEIILTDFKNHKIKKKCKTYFVPSLYESW